MAHTLAELAPEYAALWVRMRVSDNARGVINAEAAKLYKNMPRYRQVQAVTGVPAVLIALIHNRESDGDFGTHLHNGDPLTQRTYHVPAGRPVSGDPPFTWEESAKDALTWEGLAGIADWTFELACFSLEKYNGFGYRDYFASHGQDHAEPTPYLWALTNDQEPGKYVADGQFNRTAYDTQIGCIPLYAALVAIDQTLRLPMRDDIRIMPPPKPPIPDAPPVIVPMPRPRPPQAPSPATQGALAAIIAALVGGFVAFREQVLAFVHSIFN